MLLVTKGELNVLSRDRLHPLVLSLILSKPYPLFIAHVKMVFPQVASEFLVKLPSVHIFFTEILSVHSHKAGRVVAPLEVRRSQVFHQVGVKGAGFALFAPIIA